MSFAVMFIRHVRHTFWWHHMTRLAQIYGNLEKLQAPPNLAAFAWFCVYFCDHKTAKSWRDRLFTSSVSPIGYYMAGHVSVCVMTVYWEGFWMYLWCIYACMTSGSYVLDILLILAMSMRRVCNWTCFLSGKTCSHIHSILRVAL